MRRKKIIGLFVAIITLIVLYYWTFHWKNVVNLTVSDFAAFDLDESSYKDINYTARLERVRRVCKTLPQYGKRVRVKASEFSHIFVNDEYKLIYCAIPKVSSTTWKKILLKLSGLDIGFNMSASEIYDFDKEYRKKLELMNLKHYSAKDIRYRLKNYFKFIVVRDPLERLLSAYRNKFNNENNVIFPQVFGRQIVSLYRQNVSLDNLHSGTDVSFAEFVQFVVDPLTSDEVKSNAHWKSYYELCLPCIVKYDLIAKYETLGSDANRILKKLGVVDRIKFPRRSLNYQYIRTSKLLNSAYSNVSSWQLNALWDTFRLDFEMFGYRYRDFKN